MHVCPMNEEPEIPEERGSSSVENSNVRNEPGEAIAIERADENASHPWVSTSEQPGARARRRPKDPTPQEILDHEASHEPYREWCPACVAGRGRAESHGTIDHGNDALSVLGIDYGYLNRGAGRAEVIDTEEDADPSSKSSPILCGRDSEDRWIIAHLLPVKGCGHPWCCKVITEELKACGHRKILFRSDGEPAIVELKRGDEKRIAATWHGIPSRNNSQRCVGGKRSRRRGCQRSQGKVQNLEICH